MGVGRWAAARSEKEVLEGWTLCDGEGEEADWVLCNGLEGGGAISAEDSFEGVHDAQQARPSYTSILVEGRPADAQAAADAVANDARPQEFSAEGEEPRERAASVKPKATPPRSPRAPVYEAPVKPRTRADRRAEKRAEEAEAAKHGADEESDESFSDWKAQQRSVRRRGRHVRKDC